LIIYVPYVTIKIPIPDIIVGISLRNNIAGNIENKGINDNKGAIIDTSDFLKPIVINIVDDIDIIACIISRIKNKLFFGILIFCEYTIIILVITKPITFVAHEVIYSSVSEAEIFVVILFPLLNIIVDKEAINAYINILLYYEYL